MKLSPCVLCDDIFKYATFVSNPVLKRDFISKIGILLYFLVILAPSIAFHINMSWWFKRMNLVASSIWYISTGSVWLIMGTRLAGCPGLFPWAHNSLGMDRILISVIAHTHKKKLPHHLVGPLFRSVQMTLRRPHEPAYLEQIRQHIWQRSLLSACILLVVVG